jgi:hypothetical protein
LLATLILPPVATPTSSARVRRAGTIAARLAGAGWRPSPVFNVPTITAVRVTPRDLAVSMIVACSASGSLTFTFVLMFTGVLQALV